jgi:hypothetical protein
MSVTSTSHMNPSMAHIHVVIGLHVGESEGVLMCLNSLSCRCDIMSPDRAGGLSSVLFYLNQETNIVTRHSLFKGRNYKKYSLWIIIINIDPLNIAT